MPQLHNINLRLCCIALHCTTLQNHAIQYNTIRYDTIRYIHCTSIQVISEGWSWRIQIRRGLWLNCVASFPGCSLRAWILTLTKWTRLHGHINAIAGWGTAKPQTEVTKDRLDCDPSFWLQSPHRSLRKRQRGSPGARCLDRHPLTSVARKVQGTYHALSMKGGKAISSKKVRHVGWQKKPEWIRGATSIPSTAVSTHVLKQAATGAWKEPRRTQRLVLEFRSSWSPSSVWSWQQELASSLEQCVQTSWLHVQVLVIYNIIISLSFSLSLSPAPSLYMSN